MALALPRRRHEIALPRPSCLTGPPALTPSVRWRGRPPPRAPAKTLQSPQRGTADAWRPRIGRPWRISLEPFRPGDVAQLAFQSSDRADSLQGRHPAEEAES